MTKHTTVQPSKSGPPGSGPSISGAPTFLPVPPRDPRLNDKATGGGGGNLGPAGEAINPARLPEGGGSSIDDESEPA